MFLNSSTKLIFRHLKPNFALKIELFNRNKVQAGLINHICLSFSTMIWISLAEEEELFSQYRCAVETGEWGPYEALTPTQKLTIGLR